MEISILKWIDATFHSQTWLNYIMTGFTWLGEFGAAEIFLALILIIIKKTRWAGVSVAVALVIDIFIVNVILKNCVNRPRPWTEWEEVIGFYNAAGVRMPTDTSFPSGHAAVCFAAAVALMFRYKIKALPALIIAFIVALSRIYLCIHYPSDVLAGAVIGLACGIAGHYIAKAVEKKIQEKRSLKEE